MTNKKDEKKKRHDIRPEFIISPMLHRLKNRSSSTSSRKRTSMLDPQRTSFRAGQNIIYKFGFFHGKLGPKRVCALFKGNGETELELPSDSLRGACVRLDSAGEWKGWLARQMREAGLIIKSENIR